MSPRTLLTVSAIALGTLGAGLLFLPGELGSAAGLEEAAELPLQLFAGGLLAIAHLNWMGRGAIYGGIYGRPIVIANFGLGMITSATLFSALLSGGYEPWLWALPVASAAHAMAFWRLMRRPPWSDSPAGKPR